MLLYTHYDQIKQREVELTNIKIHEIEWIVNQELRHRIKFKIDTEFSQRLSSGLFVMIDKWNGVGTMRKTTVKMKHYQDYFKRAKKWWDQSKKKVFGKTFWIHIFEYIIKVRL